MGLRITLALYTGGVEDVPKKQLPCVRNTPVSSPGCFYLSELSVAVGAVVVPTSFWPVWLAGVVDFGGDETCVAAYATLRASTARFRKSCVLSSKYVGIETIAAPFASMTRKVSIVPTARFPASYVTVYGGGFWAGEIGKVYSIRVNTREYYDLRRDLSTGKYLLRRKYSNMRSRRVMSPRSYAPFATEYHTHFLCLVNPHRIAIPEVGLRRNR